MTKRVTKGSGCRDAAARPSQLFLVVDSKQDLQGASLAVATDAAGPRDGHVIQASITCCFEAVETTILAVDVGPLYTALKVQSRYV
jgi:hypothetical protein